MNYLSTGEAAARMGVSESTIRAYMESGVLQGHTLPSGHRRIDAASVDRVKAMRTRISATVTVVKGDA